MSENYVLLWFWTVMISIYEDHCVSVILNV